MTVRLEDLAASLRPMLGRTEMADAEFGQQFVGLMRALVHLDEVVVFAYRADATPIDLFSTFDETDFRIFVALYQAGPYLLDPFYQTARDRSEGLYRMRQLAPDRFYSSEYYRTYYVQTGLAEEIGFFVPLPNEATVVLSLMRRESSGPFSEGEVGGLRKIEGLVTDLVRLYWGDVGRRFGRPADPNPQIEDEESPRPGEAAWRRLNLTAREAAIVELVLKGHSSESIALRFGISTGTVKVHRRNVYRKLGISSQMQLLSVYLENL